LEETICKQKPVWNNIGPYDSPLAMQSVKGYGQLFSLAANTTIELLIHFPSSAKYKRLAAEVGEGCFMDKL
jgi:hypothetical protein